MTIKKLKEIAGQWNGKKNDIERWSALKGLGLSGCLTLILDNDATYVGFRDKHIPKGLDHDDLPELNGFSDFIGNDYGLFEMFSAFGIFAEGC
jgi:hypothetical protein